MIFSLYLFLMSNKLFLLFFLFLAPSLAFSKGFLHAYDNNQYILVKHLGIANPDEIFANNFLMEAEKSEKLGRLNDALTLYGKAAYEYSNAKLNSMYASTLIKMSIVHRALKNYKVAEDIVMNLVLKTYAKLGSKTGEMKTYQELGKIYLEEGRFTESLWFFTQQGILALETSNKIAYIESVIDIARLKIKKRDFLLANADLNRAEILAKNANTNEFHAQITTVRNDLKDKSR